MDEVDASYSKTREPRIQLHHCDGLLPVSFIGNLRENQVSKREGVTMRYLAGLILAGCLCLPAQEPVDAEDGSTRA